MKQADVTPLSHFDQVYFLTILFHQKLNEACSHAWPWQNVFPVFMWLVKIYGTNNGATVQFIKFYLYLLLVMMNSIQMENIPLGSILIKWNMIIAWMQSRRQTSCAIIVLISSHNCIADMTVQEESKLVIKMWSLNTWRRPLQHQIGLFVSTKLSLQRTVGEQSFNKSLHFWGTVSERCCEANLVQNAITYIW